MIANKKCLVKHFNIKMDLLCADGASTELLRGYILIVL
jgi:hypothetical protein